VLTLGAFDHAREDLAPAAVAEGRAAPAAVAEYCSCPCPCPCRCPCQIRWCAAGLFTESRPLERQSLQRCQWV